MPDSAGPQTIADLPAQLAAAPESPAEARARYFNSGNAFNMRLSPVPDHVFSDEPARALDPALGCPFAATSPLVLVRYARVRAGETLSTEPAASGVIVYVISGAGKTECAEQRVAWNAGDLFVLPGGVAHSHRAGAEDAVLWIVGNEPQLAFEGLRPPTQGEGPTDVVHYPAGEIRRQIALIHEVGRDEAIAGSALIFSSDRQEASRNVTPTLTVAMNTLASGAAQRAHRHNSVALTLIVQGERCFSMVDGRRKDWAPWVTTVTPPGAVHSHHNEGGAQALFLIVQDGGLYYHARTMGFEFADD
jgi:gentisate 1,2-dioxygenase